MAPKALYSLSRSTFLASPLILSSCSLCSKEPLPPQGLCTCCSRHVVHFLLYISPLPLVPSSWDFKDLPQYHIHIENLSQICVFEKNTVNLFQHL